ncbi:HAMP domain-containing protein [Nostoc sp. FACHB-87]|uniref:adenylate/guanylate cyclase domain-containing protein n=1 Tax=Nostocaceae TaxID=1162 RepID=UPI0016832659|nr:MULTISPECIES: adenylate/guanylate cyclase domain-containing protein [Nostocaceae]MBD2303463.1 HAMP domain-containing protein [Nostoc sp. FACHB-190]MBD2456262.1 HAMP domain-containing protein [Nostoc sp. FACHB-87]MBD2477683.1 HAMP domain-containing protein [Anabaena sp. FACHB-83]
MKLFSFRSIRTRIITATTLLNVALVGAIVLVWAKTENTLYREQKLNEARFVSRVLGTSTFANHLEERNWSQMRLNLNVMLRENADFVYILVSDARLENQIIAAYPEYLQGQYIPDIVPLKVSDAAWKASPKSNSIETFALTDINFGNHIRAKRGDRIIEVASTIYRLSGDKIGTLRIGVSLRQVNLAVANAVNKALIVGFISLLVSLVCAYILARRLSNPIRRLQTSAAQIASGDLQHRAEITNADEIGALANSFNEMSAALQSSFHKLQKTLASFELFVPNKFILAIAPQGIENIEVGIAVTRHITILFCDIRGYTSISEMMTPIEIFTFLNDYLACIGQVIDRSGGFIDKYIGDAVMALFDDDNTDGALKAAILMHQALDQFNQERMQKNLPKINIGIGLHRGEVVMGTVGFTGRIDSTVIGDAVNIASRIEGLTKQYGCKILVTEAVIESLSQPDLFSLKLVEQAVKLKGKDEAIAVYELLLLAPMD